MEVPEPVVEVQVNHRTVRNLGVLSFLGSGIIMIISHLHVLNCIAFFFFTCFDSFASAQSENNVAPPETEEVAKPVVEEQVNQQEVLGNINS